MRAARMLVFLVFCGVLAAGAWALRSGSPFADWLPSCWFRALTGWHCPGCGMTRAASHTLHGDLAHAFRMNPLGMLLLPLSLGVVFLQLLGWAMGRRLLPEMSPRTQKWLVWALPIGVLAYWILRNLPSWPFTLLAPH